MNYLGSQRDCTHISWSRKQMVPSLPSQRLKPTSVSRSVSPPTLCAPGSPNLVLAANLGTDDIVEQQRPLAIKHGVSFGDLYVVLIVETVSGFCNHYIV